MTFASSGLPTGSIVAVAFPIPSRRFFLLRHKERYQTAAEHEFVKLIDSAVGIA